MPTATDFAIQKHELQTVLASGIFNRAPNLEQLLKYICSKYFEGAAEEIKEYNIAVEALGRPAEFDQKRDSIVRVEAHRLRKRLKEYYQGHGASHAIHIEIPSGQYAPHFVSVPVLVEPAVEPPSFEVAIAPAEVFEIPPAPPTFAAAPARKSIAGIAVAAVVILLSLAGLAIFLTRGTTDLVVRPPEVAPAVSDGDAIRILAGVESGSYVDAFERTWQSDRYFSGGYISQTPRVHPILGTRDQRLYQSRREGGFQYDIPLKPGTYELRLHFAETLFGDNNVAGGGETTRVFTVFLNGRPLLDQFDVIGDAGAAVADIKVFKDISPGPDGKLHLSFQTMTNPAFVNAIEVVPAVPGKIRPIRIVARDSGVRDSQGRHWDPDRYAQGGQLIARPEANVKDAEPELYRGERFGNITYTIPVAQPGRYGINLYFTESWFGPEMPGGGGAGGRAFDILVNGVAVKRNFDIFREAGGNGRASIVALHGVEPNHQGKLVISLTPARNYACINALEIIDESK
jgi:hypothetical protein